MELSQNIKLGQIQKPTLKMYQSLKILQASALDLQTLIKSELNENPMLEEIKPDSETLSLDDLESGAPNPDAQKAHDYLLNIQTQSESFEEHLQKQAAMEIKDVEVLRAFLFLQNSLDERGFLEADAFERGIEEGLKKQNLEKALDFMQSCDPAGVGARGYRECFMIQLRQKKRENSLAFKILDKAYELLQKRKVKEIARMLGASPSDVELAISQIATLDLAPAKNFQAEEAKAIFADVKFEKTGGKWQVSLTKEYLPKLAINDSYRQKIASGEISKKEDKSYIKTKLRDAKNVIEAVEKRQSTLLKIANIILETQIDFFEHGIAHLKPLTMKSVAEGLGLHHTTISRAIAEKYAQIETRLLPMRYFFSTGYAKEDGFVSNTSVKDEIKKIVKSENPRKPYSDLQIAEMLNDSGLNIARRTIAKYRESLNIPPKSLRKKEK